MAKFLTKSSFLLRIDRTIYVKQITISEEKYTFRDVNQTYNLSYTISPTNASHSLTFSTSDERVATVSNGVITSKGRGSCRISITDTKTGIYDSIEIEVKEDAKSITLNPSSHIFREVGESISLGYAINPSTATYPVEFTSLNPDIVSVTSEGFVTALKKGVGKIRVSCGSASVDFLANVGVPVSSISLSQGSLSLNNLYQTHVLVPSFSPSNATDLNVVWTSDNKEVATVSENGVVTALSTGTANITVKSVSNPSATATCKVSVSINPTGIEVTPENLAFSALNQTKTVTATVLPKGANNKTVTWTTSDSSIATVSNGTITSKAPGSCIITATNALGHKAQIAVTVEILATSLTVSPNPVLFTQAGQTAMLIPNFTPSNVTNTTLTWTSQNTSVVTVDNGLLTAKGNGNTTVTTRTSNGVTATVDVSVRVPVESITLNKHMHEASLPQGSFSLTADIKPANSTTRTATWSTSNPSVATVDNGVVTIKGFGEAVIKATADGKEDSCIVRVTEVLLEKIVLKQSSCLFDRVGQTYQLSYSLVPTNAYNTSVRIAKVSGDFTVTPEGLITCTGINGGSILLEGSNGVTATFTVRVNAINMATSLYMEKIANLRASMQASNNKIAQIKTNNVETNLKDEIKKLQESYDKEIKELDNAVSNIKDNVLGGMEDGIIDSIEKGKIESSLATLKTEKKDVDEEYETVYNNKDLIDTQYNTPKRSLKQMYDQYCTFYGALVGKIEDMLVAEEITENMKNSLAKSFDNHDTAYGYFKRYLQRAIDSIAETKAQNATNTSKTYTDAQIKVQSDRITSTVTSVTTLGSRVSRAESSITQLANSITSKVDANGISSIIQQSPGDIRIGFNKISNVVTINSSGIELRTMAGSLHTRLYNGTVNFLKQNGYSSLGSFQRNTWQGTNIEGLFCSMDTQTSFGVAFHDGATYSTKFFVSNARMSLSNGVYDAGIHCLTNMDMHGANIKNATYIDAFNITVTNKVSNGQFVCASNFVEAPFIIAKTQMKSPSYYTVKSISMVNARGIIENVSVEAQVVDTFTPNTEYIGSDFVENGVCEVILPPTLARLGVKYTIVLTPIGKKDIYIEAKESDRFIVKGDDCEFDYILKVRLPKNKSRSTETIEYREHVYSRKPKKDVLNIPVEDFK